MAAGVYIFFSAATFLVYAKDKSAAGSNRQRTPEATLHFWAFIGGWPGALLAQHFLRHKSRKASFQRVFWVTVLSNAGAVAWLATSEADAPLRSLLFDG